MTKLNVLSDTDLELVRGGADVADGGRQRPQSGSAGDFDANTDPEAENRGEIGTHV